MAAKYDPLRDALAQRASSSVSYSFAEVDRLVGGLPPSARRDPTWWGNTWHASRVQAHSWLSAGYQVQALDLNAETVVFAAGTPRQAPTSRGRPAKPGQAAAVLDGVQQLMRLLQRAGYDSVVRAVAEHAVFLHPDSVAQAGARAVFPVVRDMRRRGEFDVLSGRKVLLDDNTSPTLAFLWAAGRRKGRDVQFNHVWSGASDPDRYTALWNVCATPAFLAKTTDGSNHPEVTAALRYRSWELYQVRPADEAEPVPPAHYEELLWAPHPPPVGDLQAVFRTRLRSSPKSPPALASRAIGWVFSEWKPDQTLEGVDSRPTG